MQTAGLYGLGFVVGIDIEFKKSRPQPAAAGAGDGVRLLF
jgi:hypothetical protein